MIIKERYNITEEVVINNKKINSIQGLRAIAFLAIFISHTGIGNLGALGAWGVSVFFVLSGFLMMYNYYNRESIPKFGFKFAWDKIKKLYLLHVITTILAAIYSLIVGNSILKTLLDVVIHLLLIQMWIPNTRYYTTLNGPAWYLCASFFAYLCFPLILKMFKTKITKGKTKLLISFLFIIEIIISIVTLLIGNHDPNAWFCTQWFVYYFPVVRLIDFLFGNCVGYLYLNKGEKNKTRINVLVEIITLLLIVISVLIYRFNYGI